MKIFTLDSICPKCGRSIVSGSCVCSLTEIIYPQTEFYYPYIIISSIYLNNVNFDIVKEVETYEMNILKEQLSIEVNNEKYKK